MTDKRVGLIGFGLAGATFHAPLIAATPGLRLAAIVTANQERRRTAAQQYPSARLFASLPLRNVEVVANTNRSRLRE